MPSLPPLADFKARMVFYSGFSLAVIGFFLFPKLDAGFAHANSDRNPVCLADLKKEIDHILDRPEWQQSRWGILVQPLGKKQIVYERDADKYFVPASNVKLLTTAAALLQFGSTYRWQTPIYAEGSPPNLENLTVIGQGDPSLTTAQLKDLAQQLKDRGIQRINSLTAQNVTSNDQWLNGSWEWSDLAFYFAPPVSQLNLNQNQVSLDLSPAQLGQPLEPQWSDAIAARQWQVLNQTQTAATDSTNDILISPIFGSATLAIAGQLAVNAESDRTGLAIPNPPQYFLDSLELALQNQAITVKKKQVLVNIDPRPKYLLTTLESPPLLEIITRTNHESINLYAEALLALLAKNPTSTVQKSKFERLQAQLQSLGIAANRYQLADGSGLSRQNLVPPAVFVDLLQAIAQTPYAQDFRASLAIAGQSGTLRGYQETPLLNRVQAKTGTLTGIYALSGYLEPENHPAMVFSIILNQSTQSADLSRQAIKDILLRLYRHQGCPSLG